MVAIPSLGAGTALIGFAALFLIYLFIIAFVLWLAGEIVVGRKVTFGEALGLAGVGSLIIGGLLYLMPTLLGLLIGFFLFLVLTRHYFRTGWLGAFGVSIMSVIVGVVLIFILGILAVGLFSIPSINKFV